MGLPPRPPVRRGTRARRRVHGRGAAPCPDTPPLKGNPVFLYASDNFQKPYRFKADIVVGIDDVIETKFDAIHELESQTLLGKGARPAAKSEFRLVPKW